MNGDGERQPGTTNAGGDFDILLWFVASYQICTNTIDKSLAAAKLMAFSLSSAHIA